MMPTWGPEQTTRSRFRSAAWRVKKLYPGPVGELLSREVLSWEEWGYRIGGDALMTQVVDQIIEETGGD